MTNEVKWWGYIHTNGSMQVKRYLGPEDIAEAKESPFCKWISVVCGSIQEVKDDLKYYIDNPDNEGCKE